MKNNYISSNNLVFGSAPKTNSKVDDRLVWTENKHKLLEATTDFKAKKAYEGLIWNVSRTNTHRFQAYLFQIYHKKVAENIFSTLRKFFKKDRIAPKIKQLRYKYRKVLDLGKQSVAGRPNRGYFLQYSQQNMEKIACHWVTVSLG